MSATFSAKILEGIVMLSRIVTLSASALAIIGTAANPAIAQSHATPELVLTATNASPNTLLVYDPSGNLLQSIATHGHGGVSGNAGGIAKHRGQVAVVNFGSSDVSVFDLGADGRRLHLQDLVPAVANPVSVAFGYNHLYILSTTSVESHLVSPAGVDPQPDGTATLLHADGSAGQVGVVTGQLVITEKSNAIESVALTADGAVTGSANLVSDIPANVNTPLGLATRGNDAYVTIAHANEISLVRDDAVLTITPSVTQHAPCWLALDGPFLFSANSPSLSVSRYAVYGQHIIQDAAVAATFEGDPTDIGYGAGRLVVIDSDGTNSHLSIFKVDEDGNLTLGDVVTFAGVVSTNGVVVLTSDEGPAR
jgi:hypothetical protein